MTNPINFKLRDKNNAEFFLVCLKIGIGVLVYRGTMELVGNLASIPLAVLIYKNPNIANVGTYLLQIFYAVVAAMTASLVLGISLNIGKRKNFQPMYLGFSKPLLVPFVIIATVAINYAAAEVNAIFINLISSDLPSALGGAAYSGMSWLEIVLLFVSTAVVPAIFEELVFRGLILTNLVPYGRGTAILCSALLFGLMHMNPQQFFYTTLMGVILGFAYVSTHSIWVCIAIHFLNNGLAVLQEVAYGCFVADVAARVSTFIMFAMAVLGFISIIVLVCAHIVGKRKAPEEIGSFGRVCAPALSYEERPVSRRGKILLFFSPSVALFTGIVFSSMFTTAAAMIILGFILGFVPREMIDEVMQMIGGMVGV